MPTPQEQYFEKILKSSATFLGRWQGSRAEMRELTVSHKSLRLVLTRDDQPGNLVLSCLDPSWIQGPIRWSDAKISVTGATMPDTGEAGFLVTDNLANMKILCPSMEIRENVSLR
jgi:hypothetical protein